MTEDEDIYHRFESGSFYDQNPVLAIVIIVVFTITALVPAVAMLSTSVACAIGASETFCPRALKEKESDND